MDYYNEDNWKEKLSESDLLLVLLTKDLWSNEKCLQMTEYARKYNKKIIFLKEKGKGNIPKNFKNPIVIEVESFDDDQIVQEALIKELNNLR